MEFQLVHDLTEEQIQDLHRLYQNEWWGRGRELADVRNMLKKSDLVFAVIQLPSKKLVAFARVLTDFVYKAFLFDVMVEPKFRGRNIGKLLMDKVMEHPQLKPVKHIELYGQSEMIPFYRMWGFTNKLSDLQLMRRS